MAAVYAIGYGLVSSLTGPLIIKIVGDRDVGLEFSVVTLVYGVGCVTAAPSVGELLIYKCVRIMPVGFGNPSGTSVCSIMDWVGIVEINRA